MSTMKTAAQFPELHKDRLQAVMDKIILCPAEWDQSAWHCDTKHCFGGWAQIMSGAEFCEKGDIFKVRRDARQWMGLTRYEADRLFCSINSLKTLIGLVAEMTSAGYGRDGYGRDGITTDAHLYTDESDAFSAGRDSAGRDSDGYDRAGYDRADRDRDGYDRDGYDRDGYDRDGLSSMGLARKPRPPPLPYRLTPWPTRMVQHEPSARDI